MILGKKGLGGHALLSRAELAALYGSGEDLARALEEGHPANAPAAVPAEVLARTIATMRAYHELAESLASIEDGLEQPMLIERLDVLQKKAKEMINAAPPPPKPVSRIVVPGR
jgi:hypothetical protein